MNHPAIGAHPHFTKPPFENHMNQKNTGWKPTIETMYIYIYIHLMSCQEALLCATFSALPQYWPRPVPDSVAAIPWPRAAGEQGPDQVIDKTPRSSAV